jgi:2-hydroxychromene-2-carboxylate isomerase
MTVERLRESVRDAFERIDLVPYWDPDSRCREALAERNADLPYAQMSKAKHLYILQDTKRMAQRLGLRMAWPIDVEPWWDLPHLAWLVAGELGAAEPFYDALIAARWSHGEDICTPEVIERAAKDAGLDPARLVGAPDDPAVRARGVDCLNAAFEDDVFGIPYLCYGRHRFWGLDRLDLFLEMYHLNEKGVDVSDPGRIGIEDGPSATDREAASGSGLLDREDPLGGVPAELINAVGAYDVDTAGGCG